MFAFPGVRVAIYSVNKLFEGRQGSAGFDQHRTAQVVYEVITTDDTDDVVTAADATGIPAMGAAHPELAVMIVVGRDPVQDSADPRRWLVTIRYDSKPTLPEALQPNTGTEQSPADVPENPLLRKPRWHFGFQQVTEAVRFAYTTDATGTNAPNAITGAATKPVANSAGFKFDPPPTIEISRPVITVTKNFADIDTPFLIDLIDSVNVSNWKSLTARQARCVGIDAQSNWENNVFFWEITFTFALKEDTWDLRILDAGYVERLGEQLNEAGDLVPKFAAILDRAGNPITEPVPLDGAGRKLGIITTPGPTYGQLLPETYLVFSVYRQRNFNALIGV